MRSQKQVAISFTLTLSSISCFDFVQDKYGLEDQRCYPDGSCLQGLRCSDDHVCVNPCTIVVCSGHGDCFFVVHETRCLCDSGYRDVGEDCVGPGQIAESCYSDGTCDGDLFCDASHTCVSCELTTDTQCVGGNIFLLDSCGRANTLYANCAATGCAVDRTSCGPPRWTSLSQPVPVDGRLRATKNGYLMYGSYDFDSTPRKAVAYAFASSAIDWAPVCPTCGNNGAVSNAAGDAAVAGIDRDSAGNFFVAWTQVSGVDALGYSLFTPGFTRANAAGTSFFSCPGAAASTSPRLHAAAANELVYFAWSGIDIGSIVWRWNGGECISVSGVASGWESARHIRELRSDSAGQVYAAGTKFSDDASVPFVSVLADSRWVDVSPSVDFTANMYTALAVGSEGRLTLAFSDRATGSGDIYVFERRGEEWTQLGGNISATPTSSTQLDVEYDSYGFPIVAWVEGESDAPKDISVRRWNGRTWYDIGVANDGLPIFESHVTLRTVEIAYWDGVGICIKAPGYTGRIECSGSF